MLVNWIKHFSIFSLISFFPLIGYQVTFNGTSNSKIIELVHTTSQLEKLKDTPPSTLLGLKRRADNDIENLTKTLQSLGYYNPTLSYDIQSDQSIVTVLIEPGALFTLSNIEITVTPPPKTPLSCPYQDFEIGSVALPEKIIELEEWALDELNMQGYAFASTSKMEVLADQATSQIAVHLEIIRGEEAKFGDLILEGLDRVHKQFFYNKLRWKEGDLYNPLKLKAYQDSLELSGLFKSVHIDTTQELTEDGLMAVKVHVSEAKQRTIGLGLSYVSDLGAGISGEWEDRNVGGEGQQLTFRADIWQRLQQSKLSYVLPEFGREGQSFIALAEYQHEDIRAFTESAFAISGTIERYLNKNTVISYGGMFKTIRSYRSDNNGTFDLLKAPLQYRWSNTDNILNPTKGFTLNIKLIPSYQFIAPIFAYSINTATGTFYHSFTGDDRAVFAGKLMLGSIVGASKHDIPPPERLYAGSETTLRGYKYLTVSPLSHDHKPIGGRSLIVGSLEMRFRTHGNFGWSLFYEAGNVYSNSLPTLDKELLQSVGVGLHYHTLIGPLRLDVAFPLNPRPHLDSPFQLYFSIGQSF